MARAAVRGPWPGCERSAANLPSDPVRASHATLAGPLAARGRCTDATQCDQAGGHQPVPATGQLRQRPSTSTGRWTVNHEADQQRRDRENISDGDGGQGESEDPSSTTPPLATRSLSHRPIAGQLVDSRLIRSTILVPSRNSIDSHAPRIDPDTSWTRGHGHDYVDDARPASSSC